MAGDREPVIPPAPPEPGAPDRTPGPETEPVPSSSPEAALEQARATFIEAEKDLEQKRKSGSNEEFAAAVGVYESTKDHYEAERASAVGASVEKMLDERERMVEAEIAANPRKVGYLERQWRAWGEHSLIPESWRTGLENTEFGKTRIGRTFIRSINMRTALSLSLWGVALGSGFGSVVGIGSLIARSGIGAAGTYFGSQALMEGIAQKRRFTIDQKKFKEIESFDLTDRSEAGLKQYKENAGVLDWELARLEAAALLAGRHLGDSPEYQRVREVYLRYIRTETEERPEEQRQASLAAVNKWLDEEMDSAEVEYRQATGARKIIAGGLAALFPITRIAALMTAPVETASIVTSKPATPRIISGGPVTEAAPSRGQVVSKVVRPRAEGAPGVAASGPDSKLIQVSPESAAQVREAAGAGTAAKAETLAVVEKGLGPVMAIEQGGSIWKSAMRLVETGQVSKADFEKAWANSVVEIEGQGKVPIHKVGLVHAGDKVRFVPADGGGQPRFEVIPESKMPVGSDKDLFAAYQKLGKEAPEWLKKSVGAPLAPADALSVVESPPLRLDVTEGEVAERPRSEYDTLRVGEEATDLARREAETAGGMVVGESKVAAEGLAAALPEAARAELVESLKHFDSSNLADQEAMIEALTKRTGENSSIRELIAELEKNLQFLANVEAHRELLTRLNVQDVYPKIRDMTLIEVATRSVQAERVLEAQGLSADTAEMDETSRAAMQISRLIQVVKPDGAGLGMSVDTFLKIAPQRFLEIVSSRS